MCFPGLFGGNPPRDNSAEVARQKEQERQARIAQGQTAIDEAFSGFDPAYFDTYKQGFLDFYNPQADEQFADARKNLRYNFARAGTLNSTPAQAKFGDLIEGYGDARDQIAANALSATNDLKSRVSTTKGELYNQNATAADPSAAAVTAAGSAGALTTPPAYSPLADLFSGLVSGGSAYAAGANKALPAGYAQYFTPGSIISTGTSRVVR